MGLKSIVDDILKEKNRSLSWLAGEMGKTFDGLKLSLVKETIKYKDLKAMAKVLNVSPVAFFGDINASFYQGNDLASKLLEGEVNYPDLKSNLKNCKEMVTTLRDQLKDKEKIISLLNKQ